MGKIAIEGMQFYAYHGYYKEERHLGGSYMVDVVIESDVNILDIAALSVIVTEAGGRFTDLKGGPVRLDTTSVLASNGLLHDVVREQISY